MPGISFLRSVIHYPSLLPGQRILLDRSPLKLGLRGKTVGVTAVMFVVLVGILYVTEHLVLMNGFTQIEEHETSEHVRNIRNILAAEADSLVATASDWSNWDDTYQFVQTGAAEYVQANLGDGVFKNLELNVMVFTNAARQIVYAKAFDLQQAAEIPVPYALIDALSPDGKLLSADVQGKPMSGIVALPDGPLMFAAEPILTSLQEGPAQGVLFLGRYLGSKKIQEISQVISFPLELYPVSHLGIPADVQAANEHLLAGGDTYVNALDSYTIAGYAFLNDIYGQPAFTLRTEMARTIFEQGQASTASVAVALLISGILCSIMRSSMISMVSRLLRCEQKWHALFLNRDKPAQPQWRWRCSSLEFYAVL